MSYGPNSIVVRSQFKNKQTRGYNGSKGNKVRGYVNSYIEKAEKVEPMIDTPELLDDYLVEIMSWSDVSDLDVSSDEAIDLLPEKLRFNGVGFDLNKVALTKKEQHSRANEAQKAYDRGATIRQMVVSFDTDYMRELGIIPDDVDDPISPGDFRGKIDQRVLRSSCQYAMRSFFDYTDMNDPQIIGGVHTDEGQLHIHLVTWDQDEKVKNDKGFVSKKLQKVFSDSFDMSARHSLSSQLYPKDNAILLELMKVNQKNAEAKRKLLEKQLTQAALLLDKQSISEYISGLSSYDSFVLDDAARQLMEKNVLSDVSSNGSSVERSHTVSLGQKRGRRQTNAMIKSNELRDTFFEFVLADQNGLVSNDARVIKDALSVELEHQLMIVDKYRQFQRPRVDAIYHVYKDQLDMRYEQLNEDRVDLIESLSESSPKAIKPIRPNYVTRLLDRIDVIQTFDTPVTMDERYKDLVKAEENPYHVLSPDTIDLVVSSVAPAQAKSVKRELTKPQQIDVTKLSASDRHRLLLHLEEVDEYAIDCVYWGGLGANELSNNSVSGSDVSLLKPIPTTSSIYNRTVLHQDVDLLGSDAHKLVFDEPLKPEIELAVLKQLNKRMTVVKKATDYFIDSGQKLPTWLKDSNKDLYEQADLLNRTQGFLLETESEQSKILNKARIDETSIQKDNFDSGLGLLISDVDSALLVKKHIRNMAQLGL